MNEIELLKAFKPIVVITVPYCSQADANKLKAKYKRQWPEYHILLEGRTDVGELSIQFYSLIDKGWKK